MEEFIGLTNKQIQVLNDLRNAGLYADAYAEALKFFSDIDPVTGKLSPKNGIDKSSWLWLEGAEQVNRGIGTFSNFIREYTKKQHELRFGTFLPGKEVQDASNRIADKVLQDIAQLGSLPSIDRLALRDASEAAAGVFNGDKAVWSGNLLFLFLGHDDSFVQNLISIQGDTYDVLMAFGIASGIFFKELFDFAGEIVNLYRTISNNNLGSIGTLGLIRENFRNATDFVTEAYSKEIFDKIDTVQFGTVGSDSKISTIISDYNQTQLIHAGSGDDNIEGNASIRDIIDGGDGFDTLDYSTVTEKLNIEIKNLEEETTANFIGTVDDTGITGLFDIDNIFNVEKIIGSSNDDEFIIKDFKENIELDGGDGDRDTLDLSELSISATINSQNRTLNTKNGIIKIANFEAIIGTNQNDFLTGISVEQRDGAFKRDILTGGAGADIFYIGNPKTGKDHYLQEEDEIVGFGERMMVSPKDYLFITDFEKGVDRGEGTSKNKYLYLPINNYSYDEGIEYGLNKDLFSQGVVNDLNGSGFVDDGDQIVAIIAGNYQIDDSVFIN